MVYFQSEAMMLCGSVFLEAAMREMVRKYNTFRKRIGFIRSWMFIGKCPSAWKMFLGLVLTRLWEGFVLIFLLVPALNLCVRWLGTRMETCLLRKWGIVSFLGADQDVCFWACDMLIGNLILTLWGLLGLMFVWTILIAWTYRTGVYFVWALMEIPLLEE